MSNIEIVNNVPTLNGTPVQTIIDAYSSKHGLRFTMVVVKNRSNNGFSLTLPEDFYKGNSDNKAYHGTKAHLGAAEALIEAGADQDIIEAGFRNMRKDRNGGYVPAARIFLNPPPSQSSVAYSAEADLAKAAEAFYSAGGSAEPPAAVASNPAALAGWYKGQTKALTTATRTQEVQAEVEQDEDAESVDVIDM